MHDRFTVACSSKHMQFGASQATLVQERRIYIQKAPTGLDREVRCTCICRDIEHGGGPVAVKERLSQSGKARKAWLKENSRIRSYTELICDEADIVLAVEALDQLLRSGCPVGTSVYSRLLKRCIARKDFVLCTRIHELALRSGLDSDSFLANQFIGMYSSYGKLDEAHEVFRKVPAPNVYIWSSIILSHTKCGQPTEAKKLYSEMRKSNVKPDDHVFVAVLTACTSAADLTFGQEVHDHILESGGRLSVYVGNCLVHMYSKCGSLENAREVFNSMSARDVVTWTAMIKGYTEHGLAHEALALYASMQQDGIDLADRATFLCLLQTCASIGALYEGKQLHAQVQERGLDGDVAVGSSLVHMYAKCRSLEDARRVFDRLPAKNVVTWTALISGYAEHGLVKEALALYSGMPPDVTVPTDPIVFVCLLQACAQGGALHEGKLLHAQILQRGLGTNVVLGNCLVNMYCKCGSLEDAYVVFESLPVRDVGTWTAMIAAFVRYELAQDALDLYMSMQQEGTACANNVTYACLLQACASIGALDQGKRLHVQVQQRGLEADVAVGNGLVNMYMNCGEMENARSVFDTLWLKNVKTWNVMIGGYVHFDRGQEALDLYASMQEEGCSQADYITYAYLLQACGALGASQQGKRLHAFLEQEGFEDHVIIGSCLVDMYAKFGSLKDARGVFDRLGTRDVVTWTALLNGYAEHSDGQMAVRLFNEMHQQGVVPDGTTFSCLLVACSHEGLVDEGQKYFRSMVQDYGIEPTVYHFSCMVDLYARSGYLDEAERVLRSMPFKDDVVGWTTLLSACKRHGDIERGERCFRRLICVEPENSASYVLLASLYANAGKWRDVARIERLRKSSGAKKKAAKACIEVQQKVHAFSVGDVSSDVSPKSKSVNAILQKDGGHVPQTDLVLKALATEGKEDALCGHAEKLALAYGLLNTPVGTKLLVTKNLRMCDDCHSGTKILSRLERRAIVVRDAHQVHHFVDGSCSCGDRH